MPRSEGPADPRQYVRVSVDLPMHPKLAAIDDPAAGWAYVVALCYCGGSLTDGVFPFTYVLRLAGVDKTVGMALVEQGAWHLPGHDCGRCVDPTQGAAVIHDYLRHQRSSEEANDLTEKRRSAGRKGAESRWHSNPDGKPIASAMANGMASAMANPMANAWQTDSRGEERRGDNPKTSSLGPRKRGTRIPDDFRVTEEMVAWATDRVPHIDGRLETEKFINYWRAKTGTAATKLDWAATWRNWMLNAHGGSRHNGSLGLVEVNGLRLKPETATRIADDARFAAMDAQAQNGRLALGGNGS
jgi:hypothetical protein